MVGDPDGGESVIVMDECSSPSESLFADWARLVLAG